MKPSSGLWRLIVSVGAIGGLASCATAAKETSVAKRAPGPAFYILKEGDRIDHPAPLPNRTQILVNWTFSDGSKQSQEGFRGWDMDHDGRFEMLEVMDPSGKPVSWAYDFDGDGNIDAVETPKHASADQNELESLLD